MMQKPCWNSMPRMVSSKVPSFPTLWGKETVYAAGGNHVETMPAMEEITRRRSEALGRHRNDSPVEISGINDNRQG